MEIVNSMTVWGFGKRCFGRWFCAACRGKTCLTCCPDHAARHHGGAGANLLLGIDMFKGMPTLLGRQVKVSTLGYDWHNIQRKMAAGQKRIFIHRPPTDRRLKGECKNCTDHVGAKSDYCSPACKIVHKPNGQNANLIQDLVSMDFAEEEPVRDVFCLSCLRAFASAHCGNHALHVHADAEDAGAPNLVQLLEHDGWKLVSEDVIGQPVHLERLKRTAVDGVQMAAVCRRHVPAPQGAHSCANLSCQESVDQAGDICSLECLFGLQLLAEEEEDEDDEDEEEPQSPPHPADSDSE